MAQTQFVLQAPKKVDAATALESAKQKDSRNVNFHIPAAKDEILTLTGDILEIAWESGQGKDKREGTILSADAKRADGTTLPTGVPFGFFRTKLLHEENGDKKFEAAFPSSATFEEISEYLDAHAKPGDIVITVGSGDVYRQSRKLL